MSDSSVPLHFGDVPRSVSAGGEPLTALRVTARLVWPISSPPIRNGALLVDDAGRIVALGPDAEVPAPAGARIRRWPRAVVLPGLVNVHTHLELHGLRDAIRESRFYDWLQAVRRAKTGLDAGAYDAAAREGLLEAWRHGTTTLADTGTSGAAARALSEHGGRGVYYHEVIAPELARMEEALAGGVAVVRALAASLGSSVRVGLSPHAPYTVSPGLMSAVARRARAEGWPLAGHLAESRAETAFLTEGAGPFAESWRRRGLPLPPTSRSPVRYAEARGLLGPDLLAIHVVQADDDDLDRMAARGVAVAACPRSNAAHGHGPPRLAAMMARGLRVGLGTDSVASVESLDLLAEARAARVLSGCSATAAIRLATTGGAEALGMESEVGSLAPGKWADLCVVRTDPPADPDRLPEALLATDASAYVATLIGGHVVWEE